MQFILLPTELLLYIMEYLSIKDCINLRLTHCHLNIINYNQLLKKYTKYCINTYQIGYMFISSHEWYYINNGTLQKPDYHRYCRFCSICLDDMYLSFKSCQNNNKLLVCQFKKPHLNICDCPLIIRKCSICNNEFYKFQYDIHINKCKKDK
jgi:hypothetical protein